jgi:hypothetical protein
LERESIFHQAWWLEATAPGQWAQSTVREDGLIVARLPFVLRSRYGLDVLTTPKLTQSLGPLFSDTEASDSKRQEELVRLLIEDLPPFDIFSQNLHPAVTSWLPFHWLGFTQTTNYTLVIPDLTDLDAVYARFDRGKKGDINRARRKVEVRRDLPSEALYDHLEESLLARGNRPSYSRSLLNRVYEACVSRDQGRSYYAEDAQGRMHAAIFVVWDASSAHYLISSIHPDFRGTGAGSLLVWEAIKESASVTRQFNLEGSMVESYYRSYRAFGGVEVPYSHIVGLSRRARVLASAMDLWRSVVGRPPVGL